MNFYRKQTNVTISTIAGLGRWPGGVVVLLMLCCIAPAASAVNQPPRPNQMPISQEEAFGPFGTWTNIKTEYGAVGDGKADDTDALQQAFNDAGSPTSKRQVLFLPAGTYRITKSLQRTGAAGFVLIGDSPDTVTIKWDGPAGKPIEPPPYNGATWAKEAPTVNPADMFWFNGMHSRIERITFDGAGKAAAGIAFKWHDRNDKNQIKSHRLNLTDVVFKDLAMGFDGGGKFLSLDSEVLMLRCKFLRCSEFGVGLRSFNAVNYWLWSCEFDNCRVGVSNEPRPHGGIFHVYNSVFRNSQEADATIFHSGFFGIRNCTSIGSKRFFHAKNNGLNGATIVLQGNTIIDPIAYDAFIFETLGNVMLVDNTVFSRAAAQGPVVRAEVSVEGANEWDRKNNIASFKDGFAVVDLVAIGNAFTVPQPLAVRGRLTAIGTRTLPIQSPRPAVPDLPPAPRWSTGKVFSVPANATGADVQKAIDEAAAFAANSAGAAPIVHLPHGIHNVTQTIVIPANAPIRIVGDGSYSWFDGRRGTVLKWAGTTIDGPVLRLAGPSRTLVQDVTVTTARPIVGDRKAPPKPTLDRAIVVDDPDQAGGRVVLRNCNTDAGAGIGLLVEGLDETQVRIAAHEGAGILQWRRDWDPQIPTDSLIPYPTVRVVGGPQAKAGKAVNARVDLIGTNTGRYDVRDGGHLVVRDQWYESNWAPFHMRLTGNGRFTLDNGLEAAFTHPNLKSVSPMYVLQDFTGTLALLNVGTDGSNNNPLVSFSGNCQGAKVLLLGVKHEAGNFIAGEDTRGASVTKLHLRSGIHPVEAPGVDENNIRLLLQDMRNLDRDLPWAGAAAPAGAGDVRLIRVATENPRIGLHIVRMENVSK